MVSKYGNVVEGWEGQVGFFFYPELSGFLARPDILIDAVDQQMAQIHKIDRATDRETVRTGSWVLCMGVTEHGAPLLGVLRKDGAN